MATLGSLLAGIDPWMKGVTAGTVLPSGAPGGTMSLVPPGGYNPNYVTPEAASAIAKALGANLIQQNLGGNYGPAGAPSAPIYQLDFGGGAPVDVGFILNQIAQGLPDDWILRSISSGIGYGTPGVNERGFMQPVEGAQYGGGSPQFRIPPPPPPPRATAPPPPPPPPQDTNLPRVPDTSSGRPTDVLTGPPGKHPLPPEVLDPIFRNLLMGRSLQTLDPNTRRLAERLTLGMLLGGTYA